MFLVPHFIFSNSLQNLYRQIYILFFIFVSAILNNLT